MGDRDRPQLPDPPWPAPEGGTAAGNSAAGAVHSSSHAPVHLGLARSLSDLARELHAQTDLQAVLHRIVDAAASATPGANGATIVLLDRGQFSCSAHSNSVAAEVGEMEVATGEGPSLAAYRDRQTVRSNDLRTETRWPTDTAHAVDNGVISAVSFQLFVQRHNMGALSVYSDTDNAFGDDAEHIGLILASHAAIAISTTRKMSHLHCAIDSRDLIGQAKGILMERYKINSDSAFDLLIVCSQNTNAKIRDIAEHLTASGELPTPSPRRH